MLRLKDNFVSKSSICYNVYQYFSEKEDKFSIENYQYSASYYELPHKQVQDEFTQEYWGVVRCAVPWAFDQRLQLYFKKSIFQIFIFVTQNLWIASQEYQLLGSLLIKYWIRQGQ